MLNDRQPKATMEQLLVQIFNDTLNGSKKEQMAHAAQEGAEALWHMYVAFREVGFSESQAMYLCGLMLTSQGGK